VSATVRPCALPDGALLSAYRHGAAFTDCYAADVPGRVAHARYVEAFYTTAVFKVERGLLALLASRPATDADATRLAEGRSDAFSAWTVEGRAPDQLLLRDLTGRTRSWLMVAPVAGGAGATRLYFGSAVVPARRAGSGEATLGAAFHALLGFHRLYSRVLLDAARSRLVRRRAA
jgi:hypothetical protein